MFKLNKSVVLNTIAVLITLFIIAISLVAFSSPQEVEVYIPRVLDEDKLFAVVQGYAGHYEKDEVSCKAADKRIKEIQENYSHDGFYDAHPGDGTFGENLLRGATSEENALEMWLASPLHKRNLDAPYPYSCIRCEGYYCVQTFWAPGVDINPFADIER